MRFTNKRRKSKRKIRTRKYIKKGFKGGEGNFTETCLINPFRKAGNVLKDGFNQLNELRKSSNKKIDSDLQTLSLQLSKIRTPNEPLMSPIKKQMDKIENDIRKRDEEVEALADKTEDKVESAIKKSASQELITLGDLNTRGGRKKRLRKSKKKKKRIKKY